MQNPNADETAWGRWVRTQERGVLTRAMHSTGLAWATVNKARKKLMTRGVAEKLSRFSRGAVKTRDILAPSRVGKAAA